MDATVEEKIRNGFKLPGGTTPQQRINKMLGREENAPMVEEYQE